MTAESFNQLILKLSSIVPKERPAVEKELKKFDFTKIIPDLVSTIKESDIPHNRLIAVKSLRWIADPSPLAHLKNTLLHDDDNDVRCAIIQLIGSLREASMMHSLNKIVNRDDDPTVIKTASIAIQVIQGITPASSMDC